MSFNIVVPDLGESVVEATVARWLKHEGDPVSVGEAVVVLETEKVDLEVGAEKDGVLASIQQQDGADVKVGEVLGVIDESAGKPATADKATRPAAAAAAPAPAQVEEAAKQPSATPVAKRIASEKEVDLAQVEPSKPGARVTKNDVERYIETQQTPATASAHPRARSAPTPSAMPALASGRSRRGTDQALAPPPHHRAAAWSKRSTTPPC